MWCFKCKRHTRTEAEKTNVTTNGRLLKRGRCVVCSKNKAEFVSKTKGGDIAKFINKAGKEFHLPGYNFFVVSKTRGGDIAGKEFHLPGYNFCIVYKTRGGDIAKIINKAGKEFHLPGYNFRIVSKTRGGDIAKIINKAGKEFHLPGYNFCGPGTKLNERLDSNDNPITKPVNAIDRACMRHDIAYRDNKDLESRQLADVELIHGLNVIDNLSLTEKFTRGLIKTAMKGKIAFGMGK